MSRLPIGNYFIRPKDAPEGSLIVGHPTPFSSAVPVVLGRGEHLWHTKDGKDGAFHVLSGSSLTKHNPFRWINRNNVLLAILTGSPGDFRIEAAGEGVWVVAILGEDLVLTFHGVDAYPQLTFEPANGSSAQRFEFQFVHIGPKERN